MTFLASLRPPRYLPEPDPRCKRFDAGGAVQMFRNHDAMFRMSRDFHGSPPARIGRVKHLPRMGGLPNLPPAHG